MSRDLVRLFLLLAWLCPAAHAAPADPPLAITFAEQAARLVRDTGLYSAGRGVVLREHDMLESGDGAIHLTAGGATLALGPASRLYVRSAGDLVLLGGWLKLHGPTRQAISVTTANLQATGAGSTYSMRATEGTSELFVESGAVLVRELNAGQRRRGASVPPEHFAVRAGALPLRLSERAPPAFLAAMPPGFRDELVALTLTAPPGMPRHERAARFAELAPWLGAHPLLRRRVQARFDPPRPPRPSTVQDKARP